MEQAEMLHIAAQCFAPTSEEQWSETTNAALWRAFVFALEEASGCQVVGYEGAGFSALATPPTFAEKEQFARRHFTGGLAASAQPVESLYWEPEPASSGPSYLRDSALYMRELFNNMGIEVPVAFAATPDHAALELEVAALLYEESNDEAAQAFLAERLGWLWVYAKRLESLGAEAAFYAALVRQLAFLADALREER